MKTSADWRNSRDHITFLRHFLKPAPAPAHDLREDFGETNEAVIRGLVEGGALQVCELQDLVAHAFRKQELQSLLRRHGRGIDGNKTQLAARALQAAHAEVEPRASKIMLFKCTPLGREVYEDLVKRTERAEEQGKQRTFRLLLQGKLRDAFEEPARFFREFVNPDVAGATLSKWGMHQAKLLLELRGFWALDKYREDERKLILAALAMAEAWSVKPSDWVPEELITRLQSDPRLFYLIRGHIHFQDECSRHQPDEEVRLDFPTWAELCVPCEKQNGTVHKVRNLPVFPTRDCTSELGCVPMLKPPKEELQAGAPESSKQPDPSTGESDGQGEFHAGQEPLWTQDEVRHFLARCRDVVKALVLKAHPEYPELDPARQRTLRNKIIRDRFSWAIPLNDGILLAVEEPEAVDYSRYPQFGVTPQLFDFYLSWRIGLGRRQAFTFEKPRHSNRGPTDDYFESLLTLTQAGLLLRGKDIPPDKILANYDVDGLKRLVEAATGRKAPWKTKREHTLMILNAVGTDFYAWYSRLSPNSLENAFYANPAPRGLTAEETEQLAISLRYHETLNLLLQADPRSGTEDRKQRITSAYVKALEEMVAEASQPEPQHAAGTGYRVAAPTRHVCCAICARLNPDRRRRLIHPGCICPEQFECD